jgi:hypothetical protein
VASGGDVQTLCFLSNLTSAEWAAWAQVFGSVAAIFGAVWIAIHQTGLQHRNALELHKREQRSVKLDLGKTLSVLATNSAKAMKHIASQLNDRESVHKAAEGLVHCDFGEIERINAYIEAVPLHTIPYPLVTPTMVLGSTVRQFKEKVEMALKLYRQMDGNMFEDFFRTLSEMNASIGATCKDIETELTRLEA